MGWSCERTRGLWEPVAFCFLRIHIPSTRFRNTHCTIVGYASSLLFIQAMHSRRLARLTDILLPVLCTCIVPADTPPIYTTTQVVPVPPYRHPQSQHYDPHVSAAQPQPRPPQHYPSQQPYQT